MKWVRLWIKKSLFSCTAKNAGRFVVKNMRNAFILDGRREKYGGLCANSLKYPQILAEQKGFDMNLNTTCPPNRFLMRDPKGRVRWCVFRSEDQIAAIHEKWRCRQQQRRLKNAVCVSFKTAVTERKI